MTAPWPRRGRCGACARPARAFPSGRWEHQGRPCAARSQSLFAAADLVDLRKMLVFVPEGDLLPQPKGWTMDLGSGPGVPETIGLVSPDAMASHWDRVRERLAAEAEQVTA